MQKNNTRMSGSSASACGKWRADLQDLSYHGHGRNTLRRRPTPHLSWSLRRTTTIGPRKRNQRVVLLH
ncbi:hypothetical protein, partial [Streptomyces sp. Tue6028]|uniref:hypothetical protein n=1 Tax=Streptomyces sp. Tue6028 TaxID=2036037 RepID=UPI003D74503C